MHVGLHALNSWPNIKEVIQLLNAAMSCLDGSTVETLTSFRSSLRSVVELFRRDLLMLVDELRSHGAEIEGVGKHIWTYGRQYLWLVNLTP